jgi:hypothetical protein
MLNGHTTQTGFLGFTERVGRDAASSATGPAIGAGPGTAIASRKSCMSLFAGRAG